MDRFGLLDVSYPPSLIDPPRLLDTTSDCLDGILQDCAWALENGALEVEVYTVVASPGGAREGDLLLAMKAEERLLAYIEPSVQSIGGGGR